MKLYSQFQNYFSSKGISRFYLVLMMVFSSLIIFSCGGSSSDDTASDLETPAGTVEQMESLSLVLSYDPYLKNPVTDLADCIQSVLDCIGGGTALDNCFDSDIKICTSAEPTDFCCTQQCADQITQELAAGSSEQEAILNVFVYDGTCMPGIPEEKY